MRYIAYTGNDPYLVAAMLEACETDTVALVNCSVDWIYLGFLASRTKLVSPTTLLPIVRFPGRGASYLSETGRNILFCLNTATLGTQLQALEVLRDTAIARGMTGAFIQSNDIVYGAKQIGMVAPPEELPNGRFATVMQLTLLVDFNKVEANILFPDNKWEDKPGTTNIRDWLMGIKEIKPSLTVAQIVTSIKATIASKYGIAVTNGSFTAAENAAAQALKTNKYTLDSYIRYGEW
jgi:lipoate-protein ligase A